MRMRAFTTPAEREKMLQRTVNDRFDDGDVLMLTQDGVDVATATSLQLKINIRGTILPCQGVAWVGTVRTHRRRRVDGHGLASTVLRALRQKAIERGEAVSMLAPFRVSFYEHFGFSVVERQATWTIPLNILPEGETGGFAEFSPLPLRAGSPGGVGGGVSGASPISARNVGDENLGTEGRSMATGPSGPLPPPPPAGGGGEEALASRQRQFLATHGDVETNERSLNYWLNELKDLGFRFIDTDGNSIRSQFTLGTEVSNGQTMAVVHRPWWDSPAALRDLLAMLGTLKDQYSAARITLPADLPLNWLLKEKQVPHRRVDHPAATVQLNTRMQAAILDYDRFFNALRPPEKAYGAVTVAVHARDKTSIWLLDFANGTVARTSSTEAPDAEIDDLAFTAMLFGELSASDALAVGQLRLLTPSALPLLDALSAGPKPYCHEYF